MYFYIDSTKKISRKIKHKYQDEQLQELLRLTKKLFKDRQMEGLKYSSNNRYIKLDRSHSEVVVIFLKK